MTQELLETDYFIDKNGDKRYVKGNSRDKRAGSLAEYNGKGHQITPENSQSLRDVREQKGQDAIARALAEHPDCRTDADGLQIIAEAQFVLATDPDAGRASTEAGKWLYSAGGYTRDRRDNTPQVAIQVNIGSPIMDQLAALGSADAEDVIVSSVEGE